MQVGLEHLQRAVFFAAVNSTKCTTTTKMILWIMDEMHPSPLLDENLLIWMLSHCSPGHLGNFHFAIFKKNHVV
jgi:hypothetical protein